MNALSTEEQILLSAKKVFLQKGYHGARMREIADQASINKGLLHYYFRTKEQLFRKIFIDIFHQLSLQVNEIFVSDLPIQEKIMGFIDRYIDFLMENPNMPTFVIHELHRHPDQFINELLGGAIRPNPLPLMQQLKEAHKQGKIIRIDPLQLVMSILSLCAFPFVARPMFQELLQIQESDYMNLMAERKSFVSMMVLNSLKLEKTC
jgi:AcrR family transcriptional regulator